MTELAPVEGSLQLAPSPTCDPKAITALPRESFGIAFGAPELGIAPAAPSAAT